MRNWFTICLTFNRKWELLRKLNTQSLSIFITFILERLKIIKKQMVSEELVLAAQKTNNNALVDLITQVCSAYSPIEETVDIMRELSERGYKHHFASNIGETVYKNCLNTLPTIFSLFEGYSIPFMTETKIVKKPQKDFFTSHIQKYNLKPEQCIFIDDKNTNVQAAQSVGMHGIQFKNAMQLRKELIKQNILS